MKKSDLFPCDPVTTQILHTCSSDGRCGSMSIQIDLTCTVHNVLKYLAHSFMLMSNSSPWCQGLAPWCRCTTHQHADTFAKALPCDAFRHLRSKISGWWDFARERHEHKIHDGIHWFPQQMVRIHPVPASDWSQSLQPKPKTRNSSLANLWNATFPT